MSLSLMMETAFVLVMLAGACVSASGAVGLARRRARGSAGSLLVVHADRVLPLALMLLAIALWTAAYAFELLLPGFAASLWSHRIGYVGIAVTPPLVLLTMAEATSRGRLVTRGRLALLFLIPAFTIALTLGNDYQSLVWTHEALDEVGSLTPLRIRRGPWFWLHTTYSYLCIGIAFAMVAYHYFRRWHTRRREAVAVCVAILLPWGANVVAVAFNSALDFTPLAFCGTAVLLYWVIRRDYLSELLPVARSRVLEVIDDGVLVVDAADRVLDANPAARAMMLPSREEAGGSGSVELAGFPGLAEALSRPDLTQAEIALDSGEEQRTYEVRVSVLENAGEDGTTRAVVIRDLTDRRRTEESLLRATYFDGVTELGNRRLFMDHLGSAVARAVERGQLGGLLHVKLGRLKDINKSFGYHVGDDILRAVASRLQNRVRKRDVVYHVLGEMAEVEVSRVGGDEFAIVLSQVSAPDDVGRVAMRILRAVSEPVSIAKQRFSLGASIGVCVFPLDGRDAETVARNAETAMRYALESGGSCHQFFRRELNERAERQMAIEIGLHRAIETDKLALHYQPKLDLATNRVVGAEALLRWTDERLGTLSPGEFVPIAERSGMMVSLGGWVLETVCRQLRDWEREGRVIPVSLNVSSQQFERVDVCQLVTGALKRYGLSPEHLELEVTESMPLGGDGAPERVLRDLRRLGVRVSLDDFGTGYSALGYLVALPLDVIKLDRSFVHRIPRDVSAVGVARAVIALGHGLGLEVLAEGVETADQMDVMRRLGCDQVQGFYVSRALPSPDFLRFVEELHRRGD
jgi:diguanylate cyclase (GGDEF)-like protein